MLIKALELAEKEANHSQIVNIVIEENKTETLEKRVIQLWEELSKKIESYLILNSKKNTYQPPQKRSQEAMFNGAALDKKHPITAMYMEATVNNTPIKLILDSGSTGSIIMFQLVNQLGFKVDCAMMSQIIIANGCTKLPHGEINSFPFEVNGIVIPTKVLIINTIQYQALVENDWLTKANATLDWTTQELLINYNGHQARILATCGHFQKPVPTKDLPLNLKKIQYYQSSKPISSLGLMTKEQDYQLYQHGPVKKDPNGTK
ncbi:hypothetical protein G9A89_008408 [Geosiphon pyriformis]|nr:hypothetical protein G9A89_008408 [Geosiphon pyriformis]